MKTTGAQIWTGSKYAIIGVIITMTFLDTLKLTELRDEAALTLPLKTSLTAYKKFKRL